jgi:hypothetical protein
MPVDEKKRAEIQVEAKAILDKFSKALSKVESTESDVIREKDRREEKGAGEKCDSEFRDVMFDNAEHKNKDFLIAETKSW